MPALPTQPLVLIIDDCPASIDVLAAALDVGYEVLCARSASEGLALARARLPDLILLDVMLSGMDGYQLIRLLKSDTQTRNIPVIFVTTRNDAESETLALSCGAVDFIHKPVDQRAVRERVRLHVELGMREKALKQSLVDLMQLQKQLRVFSLVIEQSPTSVVITDIDGAIEYVNPRFSDESGYSFAEAIGQNPRILQSGQTDPATFADMWKHLVRGEPWTGEFVNKRKSGEIYREEAHIAPLKDEDGNTIHYVAVKLDISERKRLEMELERQANIDYLTGVSNRRHFMLCAEQELGRALRYGRHLSIFMLDIDFFKQINDRHGHLVGDEVLKSLAGVCRDNLRTVDLVGRFGGEEFAVLLPETDDAAAAEVAERLRLAVENVQLTLADGPPANYTISIGIASLSSEYDDIDHLLNIADKALYAAKNSGRNRVCHASG